MTENRRAFLKKSSVGAVGITIGGIGMSAKSYSRIIGANEQINVAGIGTRSRGDYLAGEFGKAAGAVVTHVCDVDARVVDKTIANIKQATGNTPKGERDIRRLLEDKSIDAVFIATPDHWHAPASWMAMEAGKHVYVEKPCSHNPKEGELLKKFQSRYGKVIQMGNQQRSAPETIEVIREIHNGLIGDVYLGKAFYNNKRETIGVGKPVPVPDYLDWELWQGPAPRVAYHDNYHPYNWHWFWNWGTGETCNNGTHELDVCRWALQVDFPKQVKATGDRYFDKEDDWQFYDTLLNHYEFKDNKVITWEGQSCNAAKLYGRDRGAVIFGTKGSVIIDRAGYEVYDLSGHKIREQKTGKTSSTSDTVGTGDVMTLNHINNFLDTVRGKHFEQHSPIDEAHKSVLLCHLANIAWKMKRPLICDDENGHILNDKEAMTMWGRTYEKGWEPKI